jgi:hypothetical protein
MNRIDPSKARRLFSAFAKGIGVRAAAKSVGIHRDTAMRYRRQWLAIRPKLQLAYDALWEGDCEACDAINAPLPEPAVLAMLDDWLDDYRDDDGQPRSGWHDWFGERRELEPGSDQGGGDGHR